MCRTIDGYKLEISPMSLKKNKVDVGIIFGKLNIYTIENIKMWLKNNNLDYNLLTTQYKNNKSRLILKCNYGHISKISWNELQSGQRCGECTKNEIKQKFTKSNEQFKNDIHNIHGGDIIVLGEYKNNRSRIKVKCSKCNHQWNPVAVYLLRSGCPCCNDSKGESLINSILDIKSINNKRQFRFKDCKNKRSLPFDFAIFNNNDLLFLIEYDGEQHFRPVNFGGISDKRTINNFNKLRENDKIKNKYCKDNNILLIRIPYWQFDKIEQILEKWLRKYGVL